MSGRNRFAALGLVLLAVLAAVVMLVAAGSLCPGTIPGASCPDAGRNRAIVIFLGASTAALAVTPFAFLTEFVLRRRIAYRGAWQRAGRRGLLAGVALASLAGLRLGGALSVSVALFVLILAGLVEWFAVRRFDRA